jgi:hypothetical protein
MTTPRTLAHAIPDRVRAAVYIALGVALPLEAIWDVVPSPLEGKLLASLAALGFGVAALNVSSS